MSTAETLYDISTYKDLEDNYGTAYEKTWKEIVAILSNTKEQQEKDGIFLCSPAKYAPGKSRKNEHVEHVSCLSLDFDAGTPISDVTERFKGYTHLIYTTHRHTSEKPRFRLFAPLREPVPGKDWEEMWLRVEAALAPECDPQRKNPSSIFYLPSHPPGVEPFFSVNEGALLDPRDLPKVVETYKPPVKIEEAIPEGKRNNKLFEIGSSLRGKGASESEIVALLEVANRERCNPPLSTSEVHTLAKQVGKFPPGSDLSSKPLPKTKEEDGAVLSSRDLVYVKLERAAKHGNALSHLELCLDLGISKQRLSKIITKEKTQKYCRIKTEKVGRENYYSLSTGKGFRRVDKATQKIETFAALPVGMDKLIGTRWGGKLKKETFFVVAAYGDRGKSQVLLNFALHFVAEGLNVAYIRHESDDVEFAVDIGQRLLGRTINPLTEDTDVIWAALKELPGSLEGYVAPEESNLDEFCDEVALMKPDVCVYDYMAQELTDLKPDKQKSIIFTMVNTLAENISKQGIPFFTAVQVEGKDDFDVNVKWFRRANVALWITRSHWVEGVGMTYSISIEKNKQGGLHEGQAFKLSCDPDTWQFERAWEATAEIKRDKARETALAAKMKAEVAAELKEERG